MTLQDYLLIYGIIISNTTVILGVMWFYFQAWKDSEDSE